ncbi:MAG: hypothetical protein ACJ8AT_05650 [Hyalangium sp.]|uniref:hypothetical protein n=1 Tax=Hyalangium sp. TaxID=2028555 RepID=UPI003899B3F5
MLGDWSTLIHYALAGVADDPYVRLLKERLRSGSQIVRIHLENAGRGPEYVVILSLHRQLSEMRIPHSEAFTNWSLEAGARMVDEAGEAERFVLLLRERLLPLSNELGADYFGTLVVDYVRVLGPPEAEKVARQVRSYAAEENRVKLQGIQRVEEVLVELTRALGRSLRYDETSTSRILDAALAQWLSQHFHVDAREDLLPRP